MSQDIIVGFDSAWADNVRAPGAICAVAFGERGVDFVPPRLVRFAEASTFIEAITKPTDFLLVALDQPTVVPNMSGIRPVERVAGSIVNRLGGGVQPASRSDAKALMFGADAPIWRFLAVLKATQSPDEARLATSGRYLVEVFPALALPTLVPEIWKRRRAAKYNPAAEKFIHDDWLLVHHGLMNCADDLNLPEIIDWLCISQDKEKPNKSDQDKLDAIICLLIGIIWRCAAPQDSIVIGDLATGYMVTPALADIREVLETSARLRGVPVDEPHIRGPAPLVRAIQAHKSQFPTVDVRKQPRPEVTTVRNIPIAHSARSGVVSAAELRRLLIEFAVRGEPLSYGEVATAFGQNWNQGFGSSLKRALNELGEENRRKSEPLLMALVVNKTTRLPGDGFFSELGHNGADFDQRIRLHSAYVEQCRTFSWRGDSSPS